MSDPSQSDSRLHSLQSSDSDGHLLVFFLLAYALMWVCFFTVALARISPHSALGNMLLLLGAFAPSLSAIALTARENRGDGVNALLRRVVQWKVPMRWYIFALIYTVAVKLAVALLHRLIVGVWPLFGRDPWYGIVAAVLFSTPFQAGEEIGWRGFTLPRLAARFGLARASVLLGLVWGFWHLPQFFIPEGDSYGKSFILFVSGVTALSVTFAWLWAHTRRSLLLSMLLHAAWNNAKDIVPTPTMGARSIFTLHASALSWLTVLVLWISAVYFLARMPKIKSIPDA